MIERPGVHGNGAAHECPTSECNEGTAVFPPPLRLSGRPRPVADTSHVAPARPTVDPCLDREDRYKSLLELSPVATVVYADGTILFANRAAADLCGAEDPGELTGVRVLDCVHPDDRPAAAAQMKAASEGKHAAVVRQKLLRTDGRPYVAEMASVRTKFMGRDAVHVVLHDVTAQVEGENALRAEASRMTAIIETQADIASAGPGDTSALMHLIVDRATSVMGAPYVAAGLFDGDTVEYRWASGDNPQAGMRIPLSESVASLCVENGEVARCDDARAGADPRLSSLAALGRRSIAAACLTISGSPVGVLVASSDAPYAFTDADVRSLRTMAALVSAALKNATDLEVIRENEARFRSAFDEAPIGMALQDLEGRYLRVNRALCAITGYSEAQLLTMSFGDISHPDDVSRSAEFVRLAREGAAQGHQTDKRYRKADGSWVWAHVSASLVRADDGSPLYFVTEVQDISAEREAQDALRDSEQRFRRLWELSADGIRLMDAEGTVLMVNEAFCRFVRKPAAEIVGRTYLAAYDAKTAAAGEGELQRRVLQHAIEPQMAAELTLWDGRRVFIETSNAVLESEGNSPLILTTFRDTTETRKWREALERYRVLAENANDIMLFTRPDGSIVEANAAAARAYGHSREDLTRMNVRDIASGGDAPPAGRRGDEHTPNVFETQHRRRDGSPFPVEVNVQRTRIANEDILLNVIRDATERVALSRELSHQAFHDPLTQLPNRALFLDRLAHALTGAARRSDRVAVLFVDIDRFKVVNDSLGHHAGDQLLVSVAGRLHACIRSSDTVARFGGDEFTVLLEGVRSEGEAIRTAERIVRKLQAPFDADGHEVYASACIGIAVSGDDTRAPDDLLREADAAMYLAKATGKGKHALYERDMATEGRERLQLETDLRRAIERNQFRLYYQPIVLMETQHTIGVEALVRWMHPKLGLMPPDAFVPLQEQTGLIESFTMWVLREAQMQCLRWQQMGIRLGMSVNLSPHNLHDDGFAKKVCAMLDETGLTPNSLKLEITESAIMMNPRRAAGILNNLSEKGVRLSIDDFGTGYSSLTYLKQMPIHEIKIDRSFVLGMGHNDDDDAAIVRATVDLAHNLRKKVVAEGVESQAIWDLLNVLGCDAAQGYHMGRPMPAEDIVKWLGTSRYGSMPGALKARPAGRV